MNIEKQLATSLQAQEAAAERCYAATQKLLAAALQAAFSREGGSDAGRQALDGVLKTPVNGRSFEEKEGVLVETSDDKATVGDVLGIKAGLPAAIEPGADPAKTVESLFKFAGGHMDFKGIQVGNLGIAITIIGLCFAPESS